MRKFSIILLCLFLSGCGRITVPDIPPYTTAQLTAAFWQPIVIADTPQCSFRVEQCGFNAENDFVCEVVCHNRSDAAQVFSCEAWCIDGWQVLSFWGEEVAPGTEESFAVIIPAEALGNNAFNMPQNISFDLRIFSQANLRQNYLVTERFVFSPSGAKPTNISLEPLLWEGNDKVLADNSGCTMVLTEVRQMKEHYEVDCLLENKTRSNLMFRLADPMFNGVETDQVWTLQLAAGAKCAQTIICDLPETAGHVRWLELDVQVFSCDEWFGKVWVAERFCIKVIGL